jgi:hypothetical protein
MGDHKQALQHAHIAIGTLLKTEEEQQSRHKDLEINNRILAVAFFNLGVEYEHMKRLKEALAAYKRSLHYSQTEGKNNISTKFKNNNINNYN